ncbi:hypothetical protein AAE478_009714 [Parahypoxylon ruwenzoriense]
METVKPRPASACITSSVMQTALKTQERAKLANPGRNQLQNYRIPSQLRFLDLAACAYAPNLMFIVRG